MPLPIDLFHKIRPPLKTLLEVSDICYATRAGEKNSTLRTIYTSTIKYTPKIDQRSSIYFDKKNQHIEEKKKIEWLLTRVLFCVKLSQFVKRMSCCFIRASYFIKKRIIILGNSLTKNIKRKPGFWVFCVLGFFVFHLLNQNIWKSCNGYIWLVHLIRKKPPAD